MKDFVCMLLTIAAISCTIPASFVSGAHRYADSYSVHFANSETDMIAQPNSWMLSPEECGSDVIVGQRLTSGLPCLDGNQIHRKVNQPEDPFRCTEQHRQQDRSLLWFPEHHPVNYSSSNPPLKEGDPPRRQISFDATFERRCTRGNTTTRSESASKMNPELSDEAILARLSEVRIMRHDGNSLGRQIGGRFGARCYLNSDEVEQVRSRHLQVPLQRLIGYQLEINYDAYSGWMGYLFTDSPSCSIRPLLSDEPEFNDRHLASANSDRVTRRTFIERWHVVGTWVDYAPDDISTILISMAAGFLLLVCMSYTALKSAVWLLRKCWQRLASLL